MHKSKCNKCVHKNKKIKLPEFLKPCSFCINYRFFEEKRKWWQIW